MLAISPSILPTFFPLQRELFWLVLSKHQSCDVYTLWITFRTIGWLHVNELQQHKCVGALTADRKVSQRATGRNFPHLLCCKMLAFRVSSVSYYVLVHSILFWMTLTLINACVMMTLLSKVSQDLVILNVAVTSATNVEKIVHPKRSSQCMNPSEPKKHKKTVSKVLPSNMHRMIHKTHPCNRINCVCLCEWGFAVA